MSFTTWKMQISSRSKAKEAKETSEESENSDGVQTSQF